MKQKAFFIIFQGHSVARNSLRLEAVPLTILVIKRGLLCNFAKKNLRAAILWDKAARVWNFQLLLNSKSSKLSLHSLFKNMSKIPILELKKRGHFFQILLYFQSAAILVSQGLTSQYFVIYYISKWTVHFKCIIKKEVVMFLSFRKNKETKYISVQISKKFKRTTVFLSKMCRSKIFKFVT